MRIARRSFIYAGAAAGLTLARPSLARQGALGPDLDAALKAPVARGDVPGVAAAITDADGTLYSAAFGERRLGSGVKMTVDTVCYMASMTKPITATCAMQLVEQGKLDLDDQGSIIAAAAELETRHGRLDILVNNAGIFDFADAPPSKASVEAVRKVMNTNFLGTLAVTQALLPLLRAAPEGRIVNLSSPLGSLTLNGDPSSTYYASQFIGYNASKAALNMLTVQLHEELRGSNVKVKSVSPGFVKTDLTGYGDLTAEEGAGRRFGMRSAVTIAAAFSNSLA